MRWTERGSLKTKLTKKKKINQKETDDSCEEALEKLCLSSASSNISEGEDAESDFEEDNFELIEYFDETTST